MAANPNKQDPVQKLVIERLAEFLTNPKNLSPELVELVDTQANLNTTEFVAMLNYHRTMADEFEIFDPDGKKKQDGTDTRINKAQRYATRISIESQAVQRGARNDSLYGLVGSPLQRPPMVVEDLGSLQIKPPEGTQPQQEKKKRLGIF